MKIEGTITEDISQYKLLYLDDTEDDYVPIQQIQSHQLNRTRQYTSEFMRFIPEEFEKTSAPNIFKYNGLNNTRIISIIFELNEISDIKQIDFYLGNSYKFSIVLENLDRRYSQLIQIGYGEDQNPNLSVHVGNNNPHNELLTVGLIEKQDNIDVPSSLYSESITTYASNALIGTTLVTHNFSKYYVGELDEQN